MRIEDLPRLSDDDREAADDPCSTLAGVPSVERKEPALYTFGRNASNHYLDRALDQQSRHLFAAEAIVKSTAEAVRLRYGIDWPRDVPDYPRALESAAAMIECAYVNLEMTALLPIAEEIEKAEHEAAEQEEQE